MDKKTEGKLLDIAAELLVSPIAAYAKIEKIKETVTANETYIKTADAVKHTAKKVSESEAYAKAKEAVNAGALKAREGIDIVASKLGFAPEEEEEPEEGCCGTENDEGDQECCCSSGEEENDCCSSGEEENDCCSSDGIEDAIEEVDLSGIITEEDAKEEIPEE